MTWWSAWDPGWALRRRLRLHERGDNYLDARRKLAGIEHEVFGVIFTDSQHRLIAYKEMFSGTIDAASVYPREIVKTALRLNASALIFTHNHPSGIASPSEADKRLTARLKEALSLIDARVLDHIIVAGSSTLSFAEHGLL